MEKIQAFNGKYRFLSNFHNAPIEYNGITYPNVECAFQAQKEPARAREFLTLTPGQAKRFGRKVKMRSDWNHVRLDIMRELVWLKFSQNRSLADALLATGDAEIIEGNTWNDTFWGVSNGRGLNHLGHILMETRERLKYPY